MARMVGSFQNRMAEGSTVTPVVGMGATELMYSDRHAYTVIEVSKSGKACKVQRDSVKLISGSGHDGSAEYAFEPNPNGAIVELKLSKSKGWNNRGTCFAIGYRSEYYDPTF